MDSRWVFVTYKATLFQSLPHQAYVQDMAKLSLVNIAPELLQDQEMSYQSKQKQRYDNKSLQQVAKI
jgi:hypothetical protein